MKKSLLEAKVAADKFEGTYGAEVTVQAGQPRRRPGEDPPPAVPQQEDGFQRQRLRPRGALVRNKRWGGVTTHARMGTLGDAQVYDPRVACPGTRSPRPATGGEAFRAPATATTGRSMFHSQTLRPAGTAARESLRGQPHRYRHPAPVNVSARIFIDGRELQGIVRRRGGSAKIGRMPARADMMSRSGR